MDLNLEDVKVERAKQEDIQALVEMQTLNAFETEHMTLDPQIILKGVTHFVKEREDQFYLVAKLGNKQVGSIMITSENKDRAWIQSVYVHSQYRQKGIFKKLFVQMCKLQKQRGLKHLYLYHQKDNIKAQKTYHKLGMHTLQGVRLHGYDFVYIIGDIPKATKQFRIELRALTPEQSNSEFQIIIDTKRQNNSPLLIFDDKTLVGYAQYFEQFSDWRCGRMIYITKLTLAKSVESTQSRSQIVSYLIRYLKDQHQGFKVAAVRFISKQPSNLASIIEVPELPYYVQQIDL